MNRFFASVTCFAATMLLAGATHANAELITVRSGNGSLPGNDTLVNMLVGPANSAFAAALLPADFTAARTGADAFIMARNGAWIAGLAGDTLSQWIGTNATAGSTEGATALYAIDFILGSPFSTASLDLHYAVDNALGGGPNQGVFLNGTAISGVSTGGTFTSEFSLLRNDIAPLLVVGTNTLYINATDLGGPAGLLFRATITTEQNGPTVIPEPSTLVLSGLGLLGVLHCRRRAARRS